MFNRSMKSRLFQGEGDKVLPLEKRHSEEFVDYILSHHRGSSRHEECSRKRVQRPKFGAGNP